VSEFVDANIVNWLLTSDDPRKAERCLALFQRAQRGEVTLVTSESIIAEITFVLSSKATYGIARGMVAAALRPVLANPGLKVAHKRSIFRAVMPRGGATTA
jgi:predicted nucleic acid-binding protein